MRSFDVGPCNQILNKLANQVGLEYDSGGTMAATGSILPDLLTALNALPYFQTNYPKSIDNNWITNQVWPLIENARGKLTDKLCTCSHHIAFQLATVIKDAVFNGRKPWKILFSGGGTHNDFLIRLIGDYLEDLDHQICLPSIELINFKEAALMGLMAFLFIHGKNNVYNDVTGSSCSHIGGCFYQASGQSKMING
jgi:anhydro-N-acetylmuramic acid kinase